VILIEGPDGSGKSNLVQRLSRDLPVPIHERASTSIDGPRPDLFDWVRTDLDLLYRSECTIYDRHPFISEFIYGPITRKCISKDFYSPVASVLFRKFVRNFLVIFCDPGLDEVASNIRRTSDNQLAGVEQNIPELYYGYCAYRTMWPGQSLVWDYRYPANFDAIVTRCRIQQDSWRNSFHYA
jgi:hypothetical protein